MATKSALAALQPRTQGLEVIRFIEASCVHPDGPMIGEPLQLRDWQ